MTATASTHPEIVSDHGHFFEVQAMTRVDDGARMVRIVVDKGEGVDALLPQAEALALAAAIFRAANREAS